LERAKKIENRGLKIRGRTVRGRRSPSGKHKGGEKRGEEGRELPLLKEQKKKTFENSLGESRDPECTTITSYSIEVGRGKDFTWKPSMASLIPFKEVEVIRETQESEGSRVALSRKEGSNIN